MTNRRFALLAALGLATAWAPAPGARPGRPSRSPSSCPTRRAALVDTSARIVAEPLAKLLGATIVIDNKAGASGNIAYQQVAMAPKDGHTLLVSYSAYHVGNPAMFAKLPWAQKDLMPVALLTAATNVITAHPSVPANTLSEFIAYLKANPGKLNFASQGNGSLSHVGTALWEQATGTDMVHVPYKGSGAAIADVLAGNVQVFITTPPSVMQHVSTGKLKAYAGHGQARHPGLPTVPTTAEAGPGGLRARGLGGPVRAGRHAGACGRATDRGRAARARHARGQGQRGQAGHRGALSRAAAAGCPGGEGHRLLGRPDQGPQDHGGLNTMKTYRIGQIVPSSNTTMETEIPAMLRAREAREPERFSFHSARMRMKKVTPDELARMDADSDRCALELSDARVDVLGYACLVAIMSMGAATTASRSSACMRARWPMAAGRRWSRAQAR
jgi:tripartite-type tricarboxylate transporter receptor subunit TctC